MEKELLMVLKRIFINLFLARFEPVKEKIIMI